jgi:hypothetical protein
MIENLKAIARWVRPDNYGGAQWPEYFVFLGQHRDSDALARSNFEQGLAALGGESDTVLVVSERHWAVGWVEWIAIHESDMTALTEADAMLCALSDYPVLDEEHHSELEYDEVSERWTGMSVRDRMELCAEHRLSIFAARRDYLPPDDSGSLFDSLRG